jgi:Fanconi anemia group J protein
LYTNRLQTTPKPLEANHVVNLQKQLLAVSIGHFPTGEKLTVSYSNYHNNPNFLPKFGHAVASVLDGVPKGGCLIFFPSYSFLNKCVSCWNQQSYNSSRRHRYFGNSGATQDNNNFVWERFLRSKGKVIVEPTGGQEDFEAARDEYRETIRETGSCILLAVFRGKMSEGIDFNDENARAVICIGMPLPNWTDRSVKAKQAYNDEQRKLCNNTSLLPGRDYYSQQAYRAISQALGRCIRHGADYGTVILMDSRHCYDGSPLTSGNGGVCRAHSNLPKWMRGSVHTLSMEAEDRRVVRNTGRQQPNMIYGGYAGLKREMRQFFARAPIVSREVRDKWKADREKVISASSRTSNMVFHRDTGNWTTLQEALSQQGDSGDIEELPRKGSIQI